MSAVYTSGRDSMPPASGRQHDDDGRKLRALRAMNRDGPAVQQVGERLALDLGRSGRELDGDRAVAFHVADRADLAVGVPERLRLQVIGGGHHSVTGIESAAALAGIQARLERGVQCHRARASSMHRGHDLDLVGGDAQRRAGSSP